MHTFQSEPGIKINGSEFKVRVNQWINESGEQHYTETAWGRDQDSCGWFFIPPIERVRLESMGVEFVRLEVDSTVQ